MTSKIIKKIKIDPEIGLSPHLFDLKKSIEPEAFSIYQNFNLQEANKKLQEHKTILEEHGIKNLDSLGGLNLSGNVVPESGIIKPESKLAGETTIFQQVRKGILLSEDEVKLESFGGRAHLLKASHSPIENIRNFRMQQNVRKGLESRRNLTETTMSIKPPTTLDLRTAYMAAKYIVFEDDTTVILQYPIKYLVIIAKDVTVGQNVTFTWERPNLGLPEDHEKQLKPPTPQRSTKERGIDGTDGLHGEKGSDGYDGEDAPELDFWMLNMSGKPIFDFDGQNGGKGGKGQDGMPGGDGGPGRDAEKNFFRCTKYPGAGGHGGNGGDAGDGGNGGSGGHGGRISLFAPESIITEYAEGFYASASGGAGGHGGAQGIPGVGGQGGAVGRSQEKIIGKSCSAREGIGNGLPGKQGNTGKQGASGEKGDYHEDSTYFHFIKENEFFGEYESTDPIIKSINPAKAKSGDQVTIKGENFEKDDAVFVDGVKADVKAFADLSIQFTVPEFAGGYKDVEVSRGISIATRPIMPKKFKELGIEPRVLNPLTPSVFTVDNDRQVTREPSKSSKTELTTQKPIVSNKGTLYVKPFIESVSKSRIKPGETIKILGSGFTEDMFIYVDRQEIEHFHYIHSTEIEFEMIRPNNIEENEFGEEVTIKLAHTNGITSNEISVTLDTYQMIVFGDSIQWGQGLSEAEKFHSIVAESIQENLDDIGFYKKVYAHSGAIIGVDAPGHSDPVNGEVPASYPTVMQQVDAVTDPADHVDLILLDGGFNDVGIGTVLDPKGPDLQPLSKKYFYEDLKTLLDKVTKKFKKAKIIVTGYYQPVSHKSNIHFLEALLLALDLNPIGFIGQWGLTSLFDKVVARCEQINQLSKQYIQRAVDETNQTETGADRIAFADPKFNFNNAVFADDPFLYGVNLDLSPQDDHISGQRESACILANKSGFDFTSCRLASVGHPNPKGAKAYADAIKELL